MNVRLTDRERAALLRLQLPQALRECVRGGRRVKRGSAELDLAEADALELLRRASLAVLDGSGDAAVLDRAAGKLLEAVDASSSAEGQVA